jgi:hypothetical protein
MKNVKSSIQPFPLKIKRFNKHAILAAFESFFKERDEVQYGMILGTNGNPGDLKHKLGRTRRWIKR